VAGSTQATKMLLTDDETAELKKWVVKKLEDM